MNMHVDDQMFLQGVLPMRTVAWPQCSALTSFVFARGHRHVIQGKGNAQRAGGHTAAVGGRSNQHALKSSAMRVCEA